jgi:DNA-binding winged helix-turn-helix (wHTH) protein/Tol biopolymer transport system component
VAKEKQNNRVYAFGDYRLDVSERLLTYDGKPVPLAPRAFDVLLLLVQNAGTLVEKDLLIERVWNNECVEEGNLAKHVSVLRKTFRATSNGRDYIDTVPKHGYRFVAEVIEFGNGATALATEVPIVSPQDKSWETHRRLWGRENLLVVGTILTVAAAASFSWLMLFGPAPKVLNTTQITHSGRAWWTQKILTDGVRLYFAERTGGREFLAWAPIEGGEPVLIPTPFSKTVLLDISPDHTKLLLADFEQETEASLWTMPITGISPERLGSLMAEDAAWLPNGKGILFSRDRDIYFAQQDGSEPRRVSSTNGQPGHFSWSPDGRILRFTVEDPLTSAVSIWEASADGTNAHPWSADPGERRVGFLVGECCGVWTPDGKYFIYRSSQGSTAGLWARRERTGLRGRFKSRPVLLQTFPGELAFFAPLVGPAGKRIFYLADQESWELVRYDLHSERFVPYLSGLPARRVDSSRDGQWVTYYTQDYRLWRSRVDGTDRLQLTFAPLFAALPRWSPDGSRIAFRGDLPGIARIYLISRDGGSPEVVTPVEFTRTDHPCWSSDGNSLIFGDLIAPGLKHDDDAPLHRIDLKTGAVNKVPGSAGLSPQDMSPDGKEIAAFTLDDTRLVLFDPLLQRRMEVTRGKRLYSAYWSRDEKYIYFQDVGSVEQPIYRARISDRKIELLAGLSQLSRADAMAFSLAGVAPDGSPLASLMLNRGEIYALDVDLP